MIMAEVGCAGILVADIFCGPMRELPREGQLLAVDTMKSSAGGCAANVAIDLARQGIEVEVVGCLGKDAGNEVLLSTFKRENINCSQIDFVDDYPTSQTVILLVEGQDRRYIHTFGANKMFTVSHIDRDWLSKLKVFYLGGLFLMPAVKADEFLDLLKFCRAKGVVTVVDVVIPEGARVINDLKILLPYIDYFLPNNDEAEQLTGQTEVADQVRIFLGYGANKVIITRGSRGALAVDGKDMWQSGIYKIDSVDPSGSGDAFDAGVIMGILKGWDMSQILRYASALAASATRAVGTTTGIFTPKELELFMDSNQLELFEVKTK